MKALILAAGRGTRLRKYAADLPKGMLLFQCRPLIEHQLKAYFQCGVRDIGIVTGHFAEKIKFPGIRYFHNPDFAKTNMVESLMCAQEFFDDDLVVSYADILFEPRLVAGLLEAPMDIGVTVDLDWRKYWESRYGDVHTDIEGLRCDDEGRLISLGSPNPVLEDISGRYVGLLKFTRQGISHLTNVYQKCHIKLWNRPWQHSTLFQQGYMTDLLQELIDQGYVVQAYPIRNGWLEFDTDDDFEKYNQWSAAGTLHRFISL